MLKKVIKIDEDLCIGCGACANTCYQEAIVMVNGVAKLIKEEYCDGLGRCLPKCPTDAISFVEKKIDISELKKDNKRKQEKKKAVEIREIEGGSSSQLKTWPIEMELVSPTASFFDGADLLISADCCAYAYADFHKDFIRDRVVVIGCPKLDDNTYIEKIANILSANDIKSVTVARMEVPCCSTLANVAIKAVQESGKNIPLNIDFTIP